MIVAFLKTQINTNSGIKKLIITDKQHKRLNKNTLKGIALNQAFIQCIGGLDLLTIEGLGHFTILIHHQQSGPDGFTKFETTKHFTS